MQGAALDYVFDSDGEVRAVKSARVAKETKKRERGHLRIEGPVFGQVAEAFSRADAVVHHIQSGYASASRTGSQIAGQDFHGGGFSGPVRSEKGHHLASRDGETHVPDGGEIPIEFTEADRLDHGGIGCCFHGRYGRNVRPKTKVYYF